MDGRSFAVRRAPFFIYSEVTFLAVPGISIGTFILSLVLAVAASIAIGLLIGSALSKNVFLKRKGQTEESLKQLLEDGMSKAEAIRREAILEAKEETLRLKSECDEEILRSKAECDRELRDRRNEVSRNERRLTQRERCV